MYEGSQSTDNKPEPRDYVREVTARYIGPRRKSRVIRSAADAAEFMRPLLRDHAREHLFALYLDSASRVISHSLLTLGTANSAPAHPREVFQLAILVGACSVLLGHNHPSGDLTESADDVRFTWTIRHTGEFLRIRLLDHVIFSQDAHISLRDKGHFA